MTKLKKSEAIAVFAGVALLVYLLFSQQVMGLFTRNDDNKMNDQIQTGFTAQDTVVGTGELADRGDTISAHYVGALTTGRVFDSSIDRGVPIQFVLGAGQVIRGWDEGLVGMRVGGKRILTISPDFGYGENAVGAIPANSVLIFEVELVGVKKSQ